MSSDRHFFMGPKHLQFLWISKDTVLQIEIHPFVTPVHVSAGCSPKWFRDDHMKEVEVLLGPILAQYEIYGGRKEKKHHGCIAGTNVRLGFTFKRKPEKQTLLTKLSTCSRTPASRSAHIQGFKLVVFVCPRQHSLSAQTNVAFSQLLNDKSIADQAVISSYFQPVSHDIDHKTKKSSSSHHNKKENKICPSSSITATEIKNCSQELHLASANCSVNMKRENASCLRKPGTDSGLTAVQVRRSYQDADQFLYSESGEGYVASRKTPTDFLENVVQKNEKSRESSKTRSPTDSTMKMRDHLPSVQTGRSCALVCAKEIKTTELGIQRQSKGGKSFVSSRSPSKTIGFREDPIDTEVSRTTCLTTGDHESPIPASSQLCQPFSLGKKSPGKTKRRMHLKIKEFYSKNKMKKDSQSYLDNLRMKKSKKCLPVSSKSVQLSDYRKPQCGTDIITGNVLSHHVDELPDLMDSTCTSSYQPPTTAAPNQSPVVISLSSSTKELRSPLEQISVNGGPHQSSRMHIVTDGSSKCSRLSSTSPRDRSKRDSLHVSVEGRGDCTAEWKGKNSRHETKSHNRVCLKRPVQEPDTGYKCKKQRAISSEKCSLQNGFRSPGFSLTTTKNSEKERRCISIPDTELEKRVLRLEADLKALKQGDHYSRRHEQYMEGGRCRRLLDNQIHLEYFKEGQEDVVMDTLLTMFPETNHQSLDYIMRVLLPEALMRVYQQVTGRSVEDP